MFLQATKRVSKLMEYMFNQLASKIDTLSRPFIANDEYLEVPTHDVIHNESSLLESKNKIYIHALAQRILPIPKFQSILKFILTHQLIGSWLFFLKSLLQLLKELMTDALQATKRVSKLMEYMFNQLSSKIDTLSRPLLLVLSIKQYTNT